MNKIPIISTETRLNQESTVQLAPLNARLCRPNVCECMLTVVRCDNARMRYQLNNVKYLKIQKAINND